jgi:5'-3' exonuclease
VHLIIDGNNVAWAGFHSLRRAMEPETPEQYVRVAELGLTQSVLGLIVRAGEPPPEPGRPARAGQPIDSVTVVFDEGRPHRRRSIYPAYQTGREANPAFIDNEPFILKGIDGFTRGMQAAPVTILRGVNTEADDLIAARLLNDGLDGKMRIASTDRDFMQLVDENLSIYSPVKRVVIDVANFDEHAAPKLSDGTPVPFPRERYLDYRAASGDASDDLPGIPGVGAVTAARLVAYAPLDAYFEKPTLATDACGRRSLKVEGALRSGEARDIVARNRELMDLRHAARNYPDLAEYTTRGAWDEATFARWLKEEIRPGNLDQDAAIRALARLAEPE